MSYPFKAIRKNRKLIEVIDGGEKYFLTSKQKRTGELY
jgi:hypothetical protein